MTQTNNVIKKNKDIVSQKLIFMAQFTQFVSLYCTRIKYTQSLLVASKRENYNKLFTPHSLENTKLSFATNIFIHPKSYVYLPPGMPNCEFPPRS